jgi:hypothetical protein
VRASVCGREHAAFDLAPRPAGDVEPKARHAGELTRARARGQGNRYAMACRRNETATDEAHPPPPPSPVRHMSSPARGPRAAAGKRTAPRPRPSPSHSRRRGTAASTKPDQQGNQGRPSDFSSGKAGAPGGSVGGGHGPVVAPPVSRGSLGVAWWAPSPLAAALSFDPWRRAPVSRRQPRARIAERGQRPWTAPRVDLRSFFELTLVLPLPVNLVRSPRDLRPGRHAEAYPDWTARPSGTGSCEHAPGPCVAGARSEEGWGSPLDEGAASIPARRRLEARGAGPAGEPSPTGACERTTTPTTWRAMCAARDQFGGGEVSRQSARMARGRAGVRGVMGRRATAVWRAAQGSEASLFGGGVGPGPPTEHLPGRE